MTDKAPEPREVRHSGTILAMFEKNRLLNSECLKVLAATTCAVISCHHEPDARVSVRDWFIDRLDEGLKLLETPNGRPS